MGKRDPDYTGPTWSADPDIRAGYLTIDNTRAVARTDTLYHNEVGILVDYDNYGNVLGIEVLW